MKKSALLSFLFSFFFMPCLDFLWLGTLGGNLYKKELGSLMLTTPIWWPVPLVYISFAVGIQAFTLGRGVGKALQLGALLGLVIYGVYEFTNYSLVENWSVIVCFADIAWGIVLCGITAATTEFVRNKIA